VRGWLGARAPEIQTCGQSCLDSAWNYAANADDSIANDAL